MTKHALPQQSMYVNNEQTALGLTEIDQIAAYGQACAEAARREAIEECIETLDQIKGCQCWVQVGVWRSANALRSLLE